MRLRDDGRFGACPSERICLEITKANLPFDVRVEGPTGIPWIVEIDEPLHKRQCLTAPAGVGAAFSFVLVMQFRSDEPNGESYRVTIKGGRADFEFSDDFFKPPSLRRVTFDFVVESC